MKQWVLSIVGVVVLGVLVDVVMPEGESAKYIKGVFGVVAVITIISPIVNLFQDVNLGKWQPQTSSIEVQTDTLDSLVTNVRQAQEEQVASLLSQQGYSPRDVKIKYYQDFDYKIESINIYIACSESDKQSIEGILNKKYKGAKVNIYDE
ncbi:MAG: stage III sporulation protein AF [Christensenellales bacterium]